MSFWSCFFQPFQNPKCRRLVNKLIRVLVNPWLCVLIIIGFMYATSFFCLHQLLIPRTLRLQVDKASLAPFIRPDELQNALTNVILYVHSLI